MLSMFRKHATSFEVRLHKHMSNVYTCETKIYNANTPLSFLQGKEVRQYVISEFYPLLLQFLIFSNFGFLASSLCGLKNGRPSCAHSVTNLHMSTTVCLNSWSTFSFCHQFCAFLNYRQLPLNLVHVLMYSQT
jgi:hypothetical protein